MHFRYKTIIAAVAFGAIIGGCAAPPPPPEPPPAPPPAPEPVIPKSFPGVPFESNTTKLTPAQRRQIREIAIVLKQPHISHMPILVEGHADSVGRAATNVTVSTKRAQSVANELVFNGVPPERITVVGFGDSTPVAPNKHSDGTDNPEGRALNRRVEIRIKDDSE